MGLCGCVCVRLRRTDVVGYGGEVGGSHAWDGVREPSCQNQKPVLGDRRATEAALRKWAGGVDSRPRPPLITTSPHLQHSHHTEQRWDEGYGVTMVGCMVCVVVGTSLRLS